MVKGLAKTGSACTMAERPSVLMQAPFRKGGYSPMTRRIIREALQFDPPRYFFPLGAS